MDKSAEHLEDIDSLFLAGFQRSGSALRREDIAQTRAMAPSIFEQTASFFSKASEGVDNTQAVLEQFGGLLSA